MTRIYFVKTQIKTDSKNILTFILFKQNLKSVFIRVLAKLIGIFPRPKLILIKKTNETRHISIRCAS
jgi:hypothetical protein